MLCATKESLRGDAVGIASIFIPLTIVFMGDFSENISHIFQFCQEADGIF